MNEESKSIWKKSWEGPKAFLFWWLMVSVAGFFFATTMITIAYFGAPWALFVWGTNFPIRVLQIPELWAAFVGLELMATFIIAVGAAFVFYGIFRGLFVRRILSAPAPVSELAKQPPIEMLVVEKGKV